MCLKRTDTLTKRYETVSDGTSTLAQRATAIVFKETVTMTENITAMVTYASSRPKSVATVARCTAILPQVIENVLSFWCHFEKFIINLINY